MGISKAIYIRSMRWARLQQRRNAILPGNNHRTELRGIAAKIAQGRRPFYIAQHFYRARERVTHAAVAEFHGSPEIVGLFINLRQLEYNRIATFIKTPVIDIGGKIVAVLSFIYLHFVGRAIDNIIVEGRGVAG